LPFLLQRAATGAITRRMQTPWWRPDSHARRAATLKGRGAILARVRGFFAAAGFTEVETPALAVSPGMEPHLKPFATELLEPGGVARPLYLHTSPEFAMKKLLAAGERRIWQLARVFRNGERSATHHPEFTMLEWYRAGAGWRDLVGDCEALLTAALEAAGASQLVWGGLECDPRRPWQMLSVADAFRSHADIDLLATAPDPEAPDLDRLVRAAERAGIATHEGDRWEDLFFRIMLERIEPLLGHPVPTVLHDYPLSLAALARPSPADPRVAERFELYVAGLELANAFGELTDPDIQAARFRRDADLKERLYGECVPIDADFLAALRHGLPESAGIALGFDRLVMVATGADHIEQVLWAPVG
jgi:elongation factor P--(R)-beta-lysine ligase